MIVSCEATWCKWNKLTMCKRKSITINASGCFDYETDTYKMERDTKEFKESFTEGFKESMKVNGELVERHRKELRR